jgi:uncharacterized membrane protein
MEFETTAEIDAPRQIIWSTWADVERWPEWTTTVTWAQRLDGSTWAPGTRTHIKQPRLPALVWQITELNPGESFTWQAAIGGIRTVATHRLSPASGGRVAVTLGIRQSGLLAPVSWLLSSGMTRRYLRTEAEGLRRHCQQAAARLPAADPDPADR